MIKYLLYRDKSKKRLPSSLAAQKPYFENLLFLGVFLDFFASEQ